MSKTISLSKEFLIELLNTHCFANLPEYTNIELLDGEAKDKTQFCKTLKNTSCLDYSKLCSNYLCNYEDGCCMESCEFYNHNECPVVYVNGLLGGKDKTIADLEAKLGEKNDELNRYAELFGVKDKDFYVVEKTEYDKMKQGAKEIVEQLKQQLAEKDQEITNLKDNWNNLCNYLGDQIAKNYDADYDFVYNEILEKVNELRRYDYQRYEDKISFAVEQLKLLKLQIIEKRKLYKDKFSEFSNGINNALCDVEEDIDNQIKAIKEGK